MRSIILIFLLLIFNSTFAQTGRIKGIVYTSSGVFPQAKVDLITGDKIIAEVYSDFDGTFLFSNIEFGNYSIKINAFGFRDEIYENIILNEMELEYNLQIPKNCVSVKKCPNGDNENVIPIVYGFPSERQIKKSKEGKIKLGGCTLYCEKWHCKNHDIDF
jgi:hypothetical protein